MVTRALLLCLLCVLAACASAPPPSPPPGVHVFDAWGSGGVSLSVYGVTARATVQADTATGCVAWVVRLAWLSWAGVVPAGCRRDEVSP